MSRLTVNPISRTEQRESKREILISVNPMSRVEQREMKRETKGHL
jgi:hypothetical protein